MKCAINRGNGELPGPRYSKCKQRKLTRVNNIEKLNDKWGHRQAGAYGSGLHLLRYLEER